MTDTERLNVIEAHPNTFETYRNGSFAGDNALYWHYVRPDGFLSKGHENTLRATIDSYVETHGPNDPKHAEEKAQL